MPEPGKITERTVLNVFGPMGQGGRYILDSLKVRICFWKKCEHTCNFCSEEHS